MAHDVFISYSSRDKIMADAVCAVLEAHRLRCWIAPRDIVAGTPYGEALAEAIGGSRLLVLVFSSGANDSPQVMREVERAVSRGLPILPFRIEDVAPSKAMEYFLPSIHWLDALTPPLEKHLQILADTARILLHRMDPATANPEAKTPTTSAPKHGISVGKKKWLVRASVLAGVFFLGALLWWIGSMLGPSMRPHDSVRGDPPESQPGLVQPEPSAGLRIISIDPGSPAETAGLKPGDIIFRVDEQPVMTWRTWLESSRHKNSFVLTYWQKSSQTICRSTVTKTGEYLNKDVTGIRLTPLDVTSDVD
jgi:hypothetical protein